MSQMLDVNAIRLHPDFVYHDDPSEIMKMFSGNKIVNPIIVGLIGDDPTPWLVDGLVRLNYAIKILKLKKVEVIVRRYEKIEDAILDNYRLNFQRTEMPWWKQAKLIYTLAFKYKLPFRKIAKDLNIDYKNVYNKYLIWWWFCGMKGESSEECAKIKDMTFTDAYSLFIEKAGPIREEELKRKEDEERLEETFKILKEAFEEEEEDKIEQEQVTVEIEEQPVIASPERIDEVTDAMLVSTLGTGKVKSEEEEEKLRKRAEMIVKRRLENLEEKVKNINERYVNCPFVKHDLDCPIIKALPYDVLTNIKVLKILHGGNVPLEDFIHMAICGWVRQKYEEWEGLMKMQQYNKLRGSQ